MRKRKGLYDREFSRADPAGHSNPSDLREEVDKFSIRHGRRTLEVRLYWKGQPPGEEREAVELELMKRFAGAALGVLKNVGRAIGDDRFRQAYGGKHNEAIYKRPNDGHPEL